MPSLPHPRALLPVMDRPAAMVSKTTTVAAKTTLVGSIMQLLSGRAFAMGVAVVAAPIVARLFEPDDYGEVAVFLAMATICAVILPLGYQRAVFFPRDSITAARLLILALAVIATLTTATAGIIWTTISLAPDDALYLSQE